MELEAKPGIPRQNHSYGFMSQASDTNPDEYNIKNSADVCVRLWMRSTWSAGWSVAESDKCRPCDDGLRPAGRSSKLFSPAAIPRIPLSLKSTVHFYTSTSEP